MRRAITGLALVVLLAGPAAVGFLDGGYFDSGRLIAGAVAWGLVGVAAVLSPRPLPRGRAGQLALAGLALLTVWSGASIAWAPLSTPATDALQRLLLYTAALAAAAALLRDPRARSATEPALALGTLIVVGYGLSERLLPGIFDLARSTAAAGRLNQPLTYWNGLGAVAALGVLLCTRLAGDHTRSRAMRAAAASAAVPLVMGLWLSYSRGALAALAVGVLALLALGRTRAQLIAVGVTLAAGLPVALAADGFDGVRALQGSASAREHDGLLMLVILVAICVAAAAATWVAARIEPRPVALPGWAPAALAVAVVAVGGVVVAVAATDRGRPAVAGAGAQRLGSLESNRYDYWKVALEHGFASDPVKGIGAAGFAVIWLEHRDAPERAKVAHSLYVETLSELGIVGFALLALLFAGVAMAAARAYRVAPARAAGPIGALVVFAAHSAVDWDWQGPAITLIPLVLAGMLIALSEGEGEADHA